MSILIAGQGIAGTLLAWEFERAGVDFRIADPGHAQAASAVAAGIVNPITGQRLVKSWRVDALFGPALETYRAMERELGVPLVRPVRVWRSFANEGERATFEAKRSRGELAPFALHRATAFEGEEGFWIEPAFHLDVPTLISVARRRWAGQGRLWERRVGADDLQGPWDTTIDCTGAAGAMAPSLKLDRVKGELLRLELSASAEPVAAPDVVRNRGQWLLPSADGRSALVGATYDRTSGDLSPSSENRIFLERAARGFLGARDFVVQAHLAGWRASAPDMRPMVGRISARLGYINGLGSKGALYAPWLARQWLNHLTEGVPFDPESDGSRFSEHRV